jgi:hypothetical protein
MARGGKREGAGRKPGVAVPPVADKECAARLLEALNRPADKLKDSYEVEQWRLLSEASDIRVRLDVRKYLYDKRDGKAVQPMDFGEKPLSVIVDIPSAVTRRAQK